MPKKKTEPSKRPYKLDYGISQGHSADPRAAQLSALRYLRNNGRKHCVIEQPHGPPVDIWWNTVWGITVKQRSK